MNRVFQLVAGHPALDFVNTLDWRFRETGPEELLTGYEDLVAFTVQSKLRVSKRTPAFPQLARARTFEAARELREALANVLYCRLEGAAPAARSMARLETAFRDMRTRQRLVWRTPHAEWELRDSPARVELPLWRLCEASAELLTSGTMASVRECGNEECRWLFLDTSKNHTRRWCDMKICGNRMKARRFRTQRGE